MKRRNWSMTLRAVSRILVLAISMTSAVTVALMPLTAGAEDESTDTDAEYQAKKAAYREKLKANDVTTDDFLIGSWVSFYSFDVDSYETQLDRMAEAGMNFNMFPREFGSGEMHDAAYWDEIEAQYAKRNMVYHMNGGMNSTFVSAGAKYAENKEHCVGYHLLDEPGGSLMPAVGAMVQKYRDADSVRYPFVNLLPSYAGEAVLGGTYREYLQNFIDTVGVDNIEYLSHDFYALTAGGTAENIYADMETMRAVAYENGKLKTHAFPQSTAWNGMRMPNIDEMRWNVYAYLAYGFKALSWFNLVCPGSSDTEGEGFRDSLIYRDGTIRDEELFEAWGELNWEIRGLSDALMNLDTVHAYHTQGNLADVEYLPEDFFIRPTKRKTNVIISYMEAKDGTEPYIMIFNKAWNRDLTASFRVDIPSGIAALEYLDPHTGEYVPMDISNGSMEISFLAGEGKLFRIKTFDASAEMDRTELNAAISLTESLSADAYSAGSWQAVQSAYETALTRKDTAYPQEMINDAANKLSEALNALEPTGIDFSALDTVIAALKGIDLSAADDALRTAVQEALTKGDTFVRTGPVAQADVDALATELNKELSRVQEALAPATAAATAPVATTPAETDTIDQTEKGCNSALGAVGACVVSAMGAFALRKKKES